MIAAGVILVLAGIYWALMRTTYDPILTNIEPQDAADIVKVLDEQKIPYRLSDEGRTVLVDSSVADKARIELVGSELPMRGQVGFELFNKSDMGLTEFDQKINYQRALQGELSRTILMLEGIKAVRVHLGLPEQSVFREEQFRPKASVTITLKPGAELTTKRVRGIQRLVSGAVPDMTPEAVAVLDGTGRIVSEDEALAPVATTDSNRELDRFRDALDQAIHAAVPGLRYALYASMKFPAGWPSQGLADIAADNGAAVSGGEATPSIAYDVRVVTEDVLDPTASTKLTQAIKEHGLDESRGDRLTFVVGTIPTSTLPQGTPTTSDRVVAKSSPVAAPAQSSTWLVYWLAAVFLLAGSAGFLIWRGRNSGPSEDLDSFADELRKRLDSQGGAS
jgi:flagellar M-ring protein FliF